VKGRLTGGSVSYPEKLAQGKGKVQRPGEEKLRDQLLGKTKSEACGFAGQCNGVAECG